MLLYAIESFEDEWEIGRGNSNSVVRDVDLKVIVLIQVRIDGDMGGDARILLQGVFNKIEEDLCPVKVIADELGIRDVQFDGGFFLFDDKFDSFNDVPNTGRDIKGC